MKLIKTDGAGLTFAMSRREQTLLTDVLKQYPLVPVSHHKLTRTANGRVSADDQDLLEEAMSAQKTEQKGRVGEWLAQKGRFAAHGSSLRVTISHADMEWLLQVLNDVRVGSWLALGCPDPDEGKVPVINESTARFVFLMELSGHFQCVLLAALHGEG